MCFYGSCLYYCDIGYVICGNLDIVEVFLVMFLLFEKIGRRKIWWNLWKRFYSKYCKVYWEVYDDFCDKVRIKLLYNNECRF